MRRLLAVAAILVVSAAVPVAPTAAQHRPAARLALAEQLAWVDGDTFVLRLDVDRVRAPARLELEVSLHGSVSSRSQFTRTLDGDLLGRTLDRTTTPFEELRFDAGGAIRVPLDASSLRPGVYPVRVALVDTDEDDVVASLVTHLLRVADDDAEFPLNVAWVQPYGAVPALQPAGTVQLSEAVLDDLRTIAAQLDTGVPMTVIPTPETIAALETLDGGLTVAALAARLEDDQVVSAPYVNVDVDGLVAAGELDHVRRQRLVGDATLTDTLGLATDNRTWSLAGPVTGTALRALGDLGVSRVVLDESALEPLPGPVTGGLTLTRPFTVAGAGGTRLHGLAVDTDLVAHLTGRDEVLAAHHLLADLAVLHADLPGVTRGVVIRPPEGWRPSEVLLSTVLTNLAASPILAPVTVDDLLRRVEPLTEDDEPVVRELADATPSALDFSPGDIDRARAAMGGLTSLLVNGGLGGDLDLLEDLLLVAESSDLRESASSAYVASVLERIGAATANVRVLGERTFRLTAREGTIPITLVNDNDFDVQVDIALSSTQLSFTGSDREGRLLIEDLVLAADQTVTELVPVKARTSGQFRLHVALRSPDGRLELTTTNFTITSTVASGVGILLSAGAGLFLLLWWVSHWRSRRRSEAPASAGAE